MLIKKNGIIVVLLISIILTGCSQTKTSRVEGALSFDMYKQRYSKDIVGIIKDKTQEDGILGYSNMYTDIYTTFYALSIFDLLNSHVTNISPKVLNEKIITATVEFEQKQDFFELDSLCYLLDILDLTNNASILSTELINRIEAGIKRYVNNEENYNNSALLYRIIKIENILSLCVLDENKLEVLIDKEMAQIDESKIFNIYTTIFIANEKNITIDNDKINECIRIADKKINEIYLMQNPSFPDLYQLFELLCYIDPNYNFDSQKIMKQVLSFKRDNAFFSIATTESINLLPTYWALLIQDKLGVSIENPEQIVAEVKKTQNLDGFCHFASKNEVVLSESNSASVIYTMLGGDDDLPIVHVGNINESYAREAYCYSLSLIETKDIERINSFIYSLETSLNSISDKSGTQYLYPTYFQILSLKKLKKVMNQEINLPHFNIISTYKTDSGINSETNFLISLLDNLIKKETEYGYSVPSSVEKEIKKFISSGCYEKEEMSNNTLVLLYLSIQLIKDDMKMLRETSDNVATLLKKLLLDDGLFCFGILNREATYDSTLMGMEILKTIS